MTKVLHLADVHAGVLTHSRIDPTTGLPTALLSSLRCLEAAVDVALEEKVDAVIVAGDLYHSPNPPAAAIVGVERELARLRSAHVPTLVYPGNHDRAPHLGQRSIVGVHHGGSIVANLDGAAGGIVYLGDLVVGVLPSTSRNALMAGTGSAKGPMSREQADLEIVDRLERILGSWAEESKPPPDIVTGHWPVAGSVLGGEVDIAIIEEPMLSPAYLEGPWRYAAMGHIHRAQTIESSGKIVGGYAGGIDRFNFGEEDYDPRVFVVDLVGLRDIVPNVQPFSMPARVFRTVDLNETDESDAIDLAEGDVRAANAGGIIRIRGRYPEGDLHRKALGWAQEMAGALTDSGASIVRIEVEAIRAERVRVADISEAPTELEALELWLEANEIEEDLAGALREFARLMVERADA